MKLGISYNVFDGEELLEYSLKSVRDVADHISVVYQTTSNYGETNPNLLNTLTNLKTEGLIDKLFEYTPKTYSKEVSDKHTIGTIQRVICADSKGKATWRNGSLNELEKRDIGLKIAKANGCNIYMSMDADEIYETKQLQCALDTFEVGGYDSSFCQMQTYYKFPTHQIDPPETYYVSLFYKIQKDSKMEFIPNGHFPVSCDPTRRMRSGYTKTFTREEIEMYHYAYVRKNFESKVRNSSAQADKQTQDKIINHFKKFTKKDAIIQTIGKFECSIVIEVENKFKITI